jgi:hypothetical protein
MDFVQTTREIHKHKVSDDPFIRRSDRLTPHLPILSYAYVQSQYMTPSVQLPLQASIMIMMSHPPEIHGERYFHPLVFLSRIGVLTYRYMLALVSEFLILIPSMVPRHLTPQPSLEIRVKPP